ncbi:dihydropteroate synthase [Rubrivirga sp. IMCC43871]|uniref:dihydropteroate synthase n=1 Tax=Rubrivirga sp. IMCC43871 TaxID=3391575 RepID=UPI00398F96DB
MTHAPPAPTDTRVLDCRGRTLAVGPGAAHVMGILNVTPDSFSDGGRYASTEAAVERAAAMAHAGAAIVDVGGESTRPGAEPVGLDEELARVVPVVEGIARVVPGVLISVDTTKGAVARAALRAGAHLVNDVTGLREGVGTARAAADYGAPLVVMHGLAKTGGSAPPDAYGDVVEDVIASLRRSVAAARKAGVADVIVDPGFGFGKTPEQNLRLIARIDRLTAEGWPVLVGVSRKSTIGAVLASDGTPAPVGERLYGSLGLAALAVARGAGIVRAHDVRATVEAVRLVAAALEAGADR